MIKTLYTLLFLCGLGSVYGASPDEPLPTASTVGNRVLGGNEVKLFERRRRAPVLQPLIIEHSFEPMDERDRVEEYPSLFFYIDGKPDRRDMTPLMYAMFYRKDITPVLRAADVCKAAVDYQGRNVLHIWAKKGTVLNPDVQRELLETTDIALDRYIDKRNCFNDTPFFVAVQYGCLNVAKALKHAGADIKAIGSTGTTPLEYVRKKLNFSKNIARRKLTLLKSESRKQQLWQSFMQLLQD